MNALVLIASMLGVIVAAVVVAAARSGRPSRRFIAAAVATALFAPTMVDAARLTLDTPFQYTPRETVPSAVLVEDMTQIAGSSAVRVAPRVADGFGDYEPVLPWVKVLHSYRSPRHEKAYLDAHRRIDTATAIYRAAAEALQECRTGRRDSPAPMGCRDAAALVDLSSEWAEKALPGR